MTAVPEFITFIGKDFAYAWALAWNNPVLFMWRFLAFIIEMMVISCYAVLAFMLTDVLKGKVKKWKNKKQG